MSKTKQNIFITNNFGETQNLGENFARILLAQAVQGVSLSRDNVVALYGNLGSGKTTFVQGLARGFGIRKRIISPTFVFVRQYKVSPSRSPFGHLEGENDASVNPSDFLLYLLSYCWQLRSRLDALHAPPLPFTLSLRSSFCR